MDDIGVPVDLYIYDLSQGMARLMSNSLLGRQIDGVWHTSIVAYGREYFFGGDGIQSCSPGTIEVLQNPTKIERIGETFIPYQVFVDYIHGLGNSTFRGETYNLLKHNCNNFSNELATFLCGNGIPKYILDLPDTILNSNLNPALLQILNSISTSAQSAISVNGIRHHRQESPDFLQLNNQIEEARQQSIALEERRSNLNEKLARKERKKEKKKKKLQKEHSRLGVSNSSELSDLSNSGIDPTNTSNSMAEAAAAETEAATLSHEGEPPEPAPNTRAPSETILQLEAEERREEEERKRLREPPIVFKDLEANDTFDKLVEVLGNVELSPDEQQSLDELHQYLVLGEGSWALGDNFLMFVGRIFRDKSLDAQVRVRLLRALAACALRDDIILLLHQDRREHTLMNHAYGIDQAPVEEQTAMALFLCNMFENLSSSEWLLYISEWPLGNQQISNIRSTTKVAVHSLLSEDPTLKDIGSAIMHNLACKEVKTVVFDDVAVELTMAILQHLSSKPAEEQLFRCLKALARFCQVSGQDVPQLIQMIGPPPSSFKGASPRIDEQIELISRKLR